MAEDTLRGTLRNALAPEFANRVSESSLAQEIAGEQIDVVWDDRPERLPRIGLAFEAVAIRPYVDGRVELGIEEKEAKDYFRQAFYCWRALSGLAKAKDIDVELEKTLRSELASEPLPWRLSVAFHLAVCGVASERTAEVRLELQQAKIAAVAGDATWQQQVTHKIFEAFILLARKMHGWEEIEGAIASIGELKKLQEEYEGKFLDGFGEPGNQVAPAINLVGHYHLAQAVFETAEYLFAGEAGAAKLGPRIERYCENASRAFATAANSEMQHLVRLLQIGCKELIQNSIWTHSERVPPPVREFMAALASRGRPQPVLELWPAQQEALRKNVLTTYHRAVLVEMPTSAGKTLLAKFIIIQSIALSPDDVVAYVVPTRALVNQVVHDLRADFSGLKTPIRIEQTVSAFELDPTEDALLSNPPNVIVTTAEKLDLLIRRNHASVRKLSVVISDEAHNLADGSRGARLELLLGTIKRERPRTRFVLLSPWLPNGEEILRWLGEKESLPAIAVNWRPGNRIVGCLNVGGRLTNRRLNFETIPAADNSDIRTKLEIPLATPPEDFTAGIAAISRLATTALSSRGATLVLCRGQGTAMTRAREFAEILPETPMSPQADAVCKLLRAEFGAKTSLADCIHRKVAYHHAGIPHEARWLIELLVKQGDVNVVCGTTTLAQGVNFPISNVIIETLKKGDKNLSYQDFWNIAGRAGRTLMDTTGVVAFPAPDKKKLEECRLFLRGEAEAVVSQLSGLVDSLAKLETKFDLKAVAENSGLSELLQYLAHAMRVSGQNNLADEVEDVLRGSLVYHQLVGKKDKKLAEALVAICRSYLTDLGAKKNVQSILGLADQTGWSTPSVLKVLAQTRVDNSLLQVKEWHPESLFSGKIDELTKRIHVIAGLPEIHLGQFDMGTFNSARIASILRDWVQGNSLTQLASTYQAEGKAPTEEQVAEFSRYLYSNLVGRASWGLGALEGICLAGIKEEEWKEVGYVPSMVFYGVASKEAVWCRMVGAPRAFANGLGSLWNKARQDEPKSFDDVRGWIGGLSDGDWETVIGEKSELTPGDCRTLWQMLS